MRIPFTFDLKDGIVTVRGTAWLDGDTVVVETTRHALQVIPMGQRTFRIPADEVESIDVQPSRLRKSRLVLRLFSHDCVAGFPGDPADEIVLPVEKKHVATAESFAREVRLRNLPR